MAEGAPGRAAWPSFPQALLADLQSEAGSGGGLLQLSLWHGETITVRRFVRQTEAGVVAELEIPPAEERTARETLFAAVPWSAIAHVRTVAAPSRRGRPGFAPDA